MATPADTRSAPVHRGGKPHVAICRRCLRPISHWAGIHDELGACPGGEPAILDSALYERIMVLLGRRFQLHRMLVEAGPDGLSHRHAHEMGVAMPGMHIESLVGEGHRIETVETTINGLPTRVITLTVDAWAN